MALPHIVRTASCTALPRIVEAPPRPGFCHPADREEVARFLRRLGPEALYGLRLVELCGGPAWVRDAIPPVGRLRIPGQVALHDVPRPPWRWPGSIAAHDAGSFERAGAVVATDRAAGTTVVEWPGASLTTFLLFDVLLHEIGHHVLQHSKGKRLALDRSDPRPRGMRCTFRRAIRASLGEPAVVA